MSQAGSFNNGVFPPGEVVEALTGNTGGRVESDAQNNINVVGDGTTITIIGNPATNTLTASVLSDIVFNEICTEGPEARMCLEDNIITMGGTDPDVSLVIEPQGDGVVAVSSNVFLIPLEGAGVFLNDNTDALGAALTLGKARSVNVVENGDVIGQLEFEGLTQAGIIPTNFVTSALIKAQVDGTVAADQLPTKMEFYTSAQDTNPAQLALTLTPTQDAIFTQDATASSFTTSNAAANLVITDNFITMGGTDTDVGLFIQPKGDEGVAIGNNIFLLNMHGEIAVINDDVNANGAGLTLAKARSVNIVENGDTLGFLRYGGLTDALLDPKSDTVAASITAQVDGTVALGQLPTKLEFFTSAQDTNPPALALTIGTTQEAIFTQDVMALSFETSNTAANLLILSNGIIANGTDTDVDINLFTQGDGALVFDGQDGANPTSVWSTKQSSVQTTDATVTTLASEVVAEEQMITIKAVINGFKSTFDECVGSEVLITAYRSTGGNITLAGAPVINTNSTSTADADADVDVATQSVRIRVTGVAAETYNWTTTYSFMRG